MKASQRKDLSIGKAFSGVFTVTNLIAGELLSSRGIPSKHTWYWLLTAMLILTEVEKQTSLPTSINCVDWLDLYRQPIVVRTRKLLETLHPEDTCCEVQLLKVPG